MKRRLFLLGWLFAWIAGCGGGVGEGGTGSFSSGPISGFGSVIVNGVRFDDATAAVIDDEGMARQRDELRLGMVVAIESTRINAASASARTIRFGSEIIGPVTDVNVADDSFEVFGLTVRVLADTVFDERLPGGLASLQVDDLVEVYGFFDRARRRFVATRVEPKTAANVTFKLRAPLEAIDSAAQTITIGGQAISTAGITLPPGLAPGVVVRVRARIDLGELVATRVERAALQIADLDDVRVEGRITSFTSSRAFAVEGVPVDAASASLDSEADIVLGARVEVEGAVVGGVLIANRVKVEDSTSEFRLIGTISAFDGGARTFVVQGVTVNYPANVDVDNGTAADLANNLVVEVRGIPFAGGTRLLALRIIINP